ncbi:hypothetical protein ABT294_05145 [Nonomuraea sp. NPDC000554]|uniref:hypothetical protein n=1 Tax=Nonomuraea sp. NPDC000554 TaxID=3154259 RepID=UPI00332ECACC
MEFGFGAGNTFIVAGSICLACAAIIKRPIAVTIAMSIFVIAGDADKMRACGREWKTEKSGGQTKELDELRQSVLDLAKRLEEDAHYDGELYKTLIKPLMDQFVEETGKSGTHRDGVGDTLCSSADLYDDLRNGVLAVTGAMIGWAVLIGIGKFNPGTWLATEAAANEGMTGLWKKWGPIIRKLGFALMTVAGVYQGVQMLSMKQQMKFQDMKAVPMFNSLGLGNDKKTGALINKSIGMDKDGMPAGMQLPGATAEA